MWRPQRDSKPPGGFIECMPLPFVYQHPALSCGDRHGPLSSRCYGRCATTIVKSYQGAYGERRRMCARQLYASVGIEIGDRAASFRQTMRNFEFFGAPNVIILTTTASLGSYGLLDLM